MPRAYTLTPRPRNLSTTAILIHRLRHPLRMQRVRHPSQVLSNPGSAPTEPDGRHSAAEDDWPEEPTSQGSPYEVTEIEDRGEYTKQKYGNVDLYWNSVMVEASPEEKEMRRVIEEDIGKEKRDGRVFENTEQLYQAYQKRQPDRRSSTVPGQALSTPGRTSPTVPSVNASHAATRSDLHANQDRYITHTENTRVVELNAQRAGDSRLTWNSALTQIIASPGVDPSIASEIKARAGHMPNNQDLDDEEVDMRAVSMVPKFSYPIANACWCDACHASSWPFLDGSECDNSAESDSHLLNGLCEFWTDMGNDDVSFLDLTQSNDVDVDSLYREPTPTPAPTSQRTSDPGLILRDILEPEELVLYRKIMSHNPRFTMLLDRAETRQVSLVTKLGHLIEDLTKKIADLEGHDDRRKNSVLGGGYGTLYIDDPTALVRAFDLMDCVLRGCWERECSLLNTLLDVKDRRDRRRSALLRLLTSRLDGGRFSSLKNSVVDRPLVGSMSSSSETRSGTSGNVDLSKRALEALLQVALQNVNVLREDLEDVDRLSSDQ
ncbi:hypothetical protein E8E11_001970 [Didymella keratinophila]|nr:hypothetical protein E8E11_001970 [Didymella keratinophila]